MNILTVQDKQFYLGGHPFQILSAAMHYFRIVPEYWEDRLLKIKAAGLNTVETYIPWNLHEPRQGEFNFSGIADVECFIRLAQKIGLYVIIRPSPYICAEWDLGGLPSWLLKDSSVRLRCCDTRYLHHITNYYHELLPRLVPLQSTRGGPIIAMQVENEYGSYGNDTCYLQFLKDEMLAESVDVLLFTSDGPSKLMFSGGTLQGVLATANFGSNPAASFEVLRKQYPDVPYMVTEFWNGWFDHWGEEHHTRDSQDVACIFEEMLKVGASVNFYMFHGGTNFGFYNGANFDKSYQPTITSYDYDCPLSEWGDITPKFEKIRKLIEQYTGKAVPLIPSSMPKIEIGKIQSSACIDLLSVLTDISKSIKSAFPLTMEEAGQDYGFILYRTYIKCGGRKTVLSIKDVRDRALVFLAAQYQGTIYRNGGDSLEITVPENGAVLEILVENMGRINYGLELNDRKGITKGVYTDYQCLFDWEIFPLPLTNIENLTFPHIVKPMCDYPMFYKFTFDLQKTGDTFIDMTGWKKGSVFVNNFNIGRYWDIGPQKRLYIPAPLLKVGNNTIIVFELHKTDINTVYLSAVPDLG